MSPKIRIASSVVSLATVLACALPASGSASTLLSGYGGPGAGEQAVVGSTLLNAPHGGGSGGGGSSGPGAAGGSGGGGLASGSAAAGSSGAAAQSSARSSGSKRPSSGQQTSVGSPSRAGGVYAYPTALRSKGGSPALGLSEGDLLVALGIVAALALLGGLTFRTARLQR